MCDTFAFLCQVVNSAGAETAQIENGRNCSFVCGVNKNRNIRDKLSENWYLNFIADKCGPLLTTEPADFLLKTKKN